MLLAVGDVTHAFQNGWSHFSSLLGNGFGDIFHESQSTRRRVGRQARTGLSPVASDEGDSARARGEHLMVDSIPCMPNRSTATENPCIPSKPTAPSAVGVQGSEMTPPHRSVSMRSVHNFPLQPVAKQGLDLDEYEAGSDRAARVQASNPVKYEYSKVAEHSQHNDRSEVSGVWSYMYPCSAQDTRTT